LLLNFQICPSTCINTLTLHDALPIWLRETREDTSRFATFHLFPDSTKMIQGKQAHKVVYSLASGDSLTYTAWYSSDFPSWIWERSEEHTSELQSRFDLVCRLLLEQ